MSLGQRACFDHIPPRSVLIYRAGLWWDLRRHATLVRWEALKETDHYKGAAAAARRWRGRCEALPTVQWAATAAGACRWKARVLRRRVKLVWDGLPTCKVTKLEDLHGVRECRGRAAAERRLHWGEFKVIAAADAPSRLCAVCTHCAGIDNAARTHWCVHAP